MIIKDSSYTISRYINTSLAPPTFQMQCLRKIMRIRWDQRVSNAEVLERTGQKYVVETTTSRRMSWLGHIFRMNNNRLPLQILDWIPPNGNRRSRKLRSTYRNCMTSFLEDMGLSWTQARAMVQDRPVWSDFVALNAEMYSRR